MAVALLAAGSMAAALQLGDTERTGTKLLMKRATRGREPVVLDIRSLPTHDVGVPAYDDTDVRTMLEQEADLQGGTVRPNGDACDSLVLWNAEAVVDLVHHTFLGHMGAMEKSSADSHVAVEDNSDPALRAASPKAAREPRK